MAVAEKLKKDALERRHIDAEVELVEGQYQYRVNYLPKEDAKVSIIIPSKDNYKMLKRCIESLADNGSNETNHQEYEKLSEQFGMKYLYRPMQFNFSKMCNMGAREASGKFLLFLNDDIEIIDGKWLTRMTGHAQLDHVGAVGVKLLYPNSDRIQHAGVINITSGPVHCFGNYSDKDSYYYGRNKLDYNFLAVTAACLMVEAKKTGRSVDSGKIWRLLIMT